MHVRRSSADLSDKIIKKPPEFSHFPIDTPHEITDNEYDEIPYMVLLEIAEHNMLIP
jgi:hypothetical protein